MVCEPDPNRETDLVICDNEINKVTMESCFAKLVTDFPLV